MDSYCRELNNQCTFEEIACGSFALCVVRWHRLVDMWPDSALVAMSSFRAYTTRPLSVVV